MYPFQFQNPSFKLVKDLFDGTKRKSKDYYSLLVLKKARLPNHSQKLKSDLNLSDEALKNAFLLPHSAAFEPYVKAFQYKVLNSILYTNTKLHKIGYISDNLCSFCEQETETLQHVLYFYSQQIHLNWKEVLIGVLTPGCPLLNYLLLLGKIYLWDCIRNKKLPNVRGFKFKVNLNYETEKYICTKNSNLDEFREKWIL